MAKVVRRGESNHAPGGGARGRGQGYETYRDFPSKALGVRESRFRNWSLPLPVNTEKKMVAVKHEKHKWSWAIYSDYHEDSGLIGIYWWARRKLSKQGVPEWHAGCPYALFQTRAQARKRLPDIKGTFPKARVVKVSLLVHIHG